MSATLVGRDAELHALSDLLATSRLVEIVGPGGIGKTAVAIATGRLLNRSDGVGRDGVWLARLETATTADEVTDVLIAALGVTGGMPALLERLRGTSALVILDNCEHVVDAAAALAVQLLDTAPGLRVLCTSQVPLDVDGEAVFELAPLALDDAVELFTQRATTRRDPERGDRCGRHRGEPVPFARRSSTRHRARGGSYQDVVDRGDHPPPRRPVQRVERPHQPQTGTASRAQVDDPVELRAAVPR